MKTVAYKPATLKALRKMPVDPARRIMGKIAEYATDPASQAKYVNALKGREGIRLRVGDWRVIMTDAGEIFDLLEIGPRGGVYA